MRTEVLEKLRNQLKLSKDDFANQIGLTLSDYNMFIHNTEMLPAQTVIKVKTIMLDEEQKNLEEFYNRFANQKSSIFTSNKILSHFDKLRDYLCPETRKEVGPVTVEMHPSTFCNHACPGCTFSVKELSPQQKHNFDMKLLPNLVEDMKTLGVKGVNLSGGGEPLCHPKWQEIIRALNQHFDVGLITNGQLLKDPKPVIDYCQWVRFSVDAGSDTVYKEMHGNVADFDETVAAIERAVQCKRENNSDITIGVSYLLTPYNYLDVLPAINTFRKIGVDYIQIKPIVLFPEDRLNLAFIFWDKEIFSLLSNVSAYSTDTFKVYTISYKFAELIKYEKTGIPFKKCYGHALYPTITSEGVVLTCCFKLNDYNNGSKSGYYGKITADNRLIDIWNSDYRYKQGEELNTRYCPINCKIAETNKILMELETNKVQHSSFIN